MTIQQTNSYPYLTPVRVVATSNQSITYSNGTLNNGVGATATYATGALTIDSVVVQLGDRVLLQAQTAANQNGIYICTTQGATGVAAVLTRTEDSQCIEQLLLGQYVSVSAGTLNKGAMFCLVEPKPAHFGVDDMTWAASPLNSNLGTAATKAASDNAEPTVASVSGATVLNNMLVAADTAGTVKDAGARIIANTTAAYAGGGTSNAFTATGLTVNAKGSAVIRTSTNAVAIAKALPGTNTLTITFTADPGASTTVDYIYSTASLA
jgi:hypothetical protein